MHKARYGSIHGPVVTAKEFRDKATAEYREKGIFPYCEHCHEIVELYGVNTPNGKTPDRFDHRNRPAGWDPLDDCVESKRELGLGPSGYDEARGVQMREMFFIDENLIRAYAFCLALCRNGNLPVSKFRSMLVRADRKRVWSYVGVPLWAFPYILLTLENFTGKTQNGRTFDFHFTFSKPRGSNISALWDCFDECHLVKRFENKDEIQAPDNPYPVSEKSFQEKFGDTSWISPALLQKLKLAA